MGRYGTYECMQLESSASTEDMYVDVSENTELQIHYDFYRDGFKSPRAEVVAIANQYFVANLSVWQTPLYCASTVGTGADNPHNPHNLTDFQRSRSVMFTLVNTSAFEVRYSISPCCSSGRNFLFAG